MRYPPGFEWDVAKVDRNRDKHGVDFAFATLIFSGQFQEWLDERDYQGEIRHQAVGQADGRRIVVIYTWRESRRRIISAWSAGSRR